MNDNFFGQTRKVRFTVLSFHDNWVFTVLFPQGTKFDNGMFIVLSPTMPYAGYMANVDTVYESDNARYNATWSIFKIFRQWTMEIVDNC